VVAIRKLFGAAVIKLRPGMSAQAAALSVHTEFDTDCNGIIDRTEFGVMVSKVLAMRVASDVEALLWASCCRHKTFAKWVVGGSTSDDPSKRIIDRVEFGELISQVLAMRMPAYVEELLWASFCRHKTFAKWVREEKANEPDSRPQPGVVHCWGNHDGAAQKGLNARPDPAAGSGARPRPRPPSVSTTTVNLTAAAAQLTGPTRDPVPNGTGLLTAPTWASSRTPPATSPTRTRRLLASQATAPQPFSGAAGGASGMSEAAREYLLTRSLTPIQSTRQLQADKPARGRRQQPDAHAAEVRKRQQVVKAQQAPQTVVRVRALAPATTSATSISLMTIASSPVVRRTRPRPRPGGQSPKSTQTGRMT
jgi:hypothetical protein